MEETREIIRNIKKELRLFMNGVTSAQQRKLGMNYNIIFGVEIPRLKEIAAKFPVDVALAKTLWKENMLTMNTSTLSLMKRAEHSNLTQLKEANIIVHISSSAEHVLDVAKLLT